MLKLKKFVRITILSFSLLGLAGGAVAVTHAPSFTIADGSSGTIDAG